MEIPAYYLGAGMMLFLFLLPFLCTHHVLVLYKRYNTAAAYFDSSGNRFTVGRPGASLDTAAVLFIRSLM